MSEEILFEAGPVKITPARVVSGGSTYAVANITSVKALSDNKLQVYGVVTVVCGLAFALLGKPVSIVLGVLAIITGVGLTIFGKFTEIVITTGAAESQAFRSRDEKVALEVASAINLAIMKRSAR